MNKQDIFDMLPSSLLKAYFKSRGFTEMMNTQVIPEVAMDVIIGKENELWKERMSQVNGHEPEICQWLYQNVKDMDVFFDVGSHFGYFPAFLSNLERSVDIHCFQPSMYTFNFLRINQRHYEKKNQWKVNRKYVSTENDAQHVSLDAYSKGLGKFPNLIKIDIDGPEVFALRGCESIIANRTTRFLVEIHPKAMHELHGHTWDDIFELIPSDYTIKYLPNVRGISKWSDSFDAVKEDDNPYIYFCPEMLKVDLF